MVCATEIPDDQIPEEIHASTVGHDQTSAQINPPPAFDLNRAVLSLFIKPKNLETVLGCADGSNVFCTGCRGYLLASVGINQQGQGRQQKTRRAKKQAPMLTYGNEAGEALIIQSVEPTSKSNKLRAQPKKITSSSTLQGHERTNEGCIYITDSEL
jgi:hypothetical protein